MRRRELNRVMRAIGELSWSQRREVMQRLKAAQAGQEAHSIVEERLQVLRFCPHCSGAHIVRHGTAHGLQRYRCRGCGKTFNALTRTPLARLRCRERWLDQSQVLIDGLSITRAAERLEVARSTAFRWRHRFLSLPQHVRAGQLAGIVEADETGILKSCKGQPGQRKALGRPARGRRASSYLSRHQAAIGLLLPRATAALTTSVRSGLRVTVSMCDQLRVALDHRRGLSWRARM
jgi:transposase-like protein